MHSSRNMNRYINSAILAIISISVCSCGLYKKFEGAEVPTDSESLYRYVESTSDSSSIATLSWREFFTDNELQSLVEEALTNNTNLQIAHSNVAQAEAVLSSSKLAYYPALSLTPNGTISNSAEGTTRSYNIGATAQWEIDIFGRLTAAKRQDQALFEQSVAYSQAVQTELIATVAQSYYQLLMLDRQLEITLETVINWEDNIRVIKALKRVGRSNEAAVAQAEASKLNIESLAISYQAQIESLENTLCALVGCSPRAIERSRLESQKFPDHITTGLPIELLSNRPDVKSAEYNLAAAYYNMIGSKAEFYPSLSISGTAGWQGSGGVTVNPAELIASATASLVQPIFNRGVLKSQLKVAKESQEQARLTFNQTLLDAAVEVNNAIIEWQSAIKQIEKERLRITSLESAVKSTELLMKHSSQNYLDVLIAQNSLLQAQTSLVTENNAQISGMITLYRALGGGTK